MRILVTGGCGFIGSAVIHQLLRTGAQVINLDKLTYAANPDALAQWYGTGRYEIVEGDVCDRDLVDSLFEDNNPDAVIHMAAESHVDRSIDSPALFLQTNFVGTFTMLEAARAWRAGRRSEFRFHHVSTDEVFGSLGPTEPAFRESSRYKPNSPYAASKACADHLVRAWGETYGLPTVTTNCSNNYGPWQFPEKMIPLMILNAIEGKTLPLYGAGDNIRDWLHVEDHAHAVNHVLHHGRTGESYNVGGEAEHQNLDVVRMICTELDQRLPDRAPHDRMIRHVADRVAHDRRYAVDTTKIRRELGWRPNTDFHSGLSRTVDWYLDNRTWWKPIREQRYGGERLGQSAA